MANGRLDDGALTLDHYRRLAELAERLCGSRFAIYSHRYDYQAFGSWQLVAGRGSRRFRFTWDGRDKHLDIEVGVVQNGRVASWSQCVTDPKTTFDDPFDHVAATLQSDLAT